MAAMPVPAPKPSTLRMEKHLRETFERVREKLATVSGDSGMIRLHPDQTKRACEAYDEHLDNGHADDEAEPEE
ncbi:hypothetical protein LCGC14_0274090 [marine sediment metagenome]|uniref:Uncharacterized protein n=2 Tax=root TaxID=1 RepID=A0A9C9TGG6_9HYPH|nr:hypothetical protein [Aurantimonas coralicida]